MNGRDKAVQAIIDSIDRAFVFGVERVPPLFVCDERRAYVVEGKEDMRDHFGGGPSPSQLRPVRDTDVVTDEDRRRLAKAWRDGRRRVRGARGDRHLQQLLARYGGK